MNRYWSGQWRNQWNSTSRLQHCTCTKIRKGGGVSVIYDKGLDVKHHFDTDSITHFEYIECTVRNKCMAFRLFVIYRPPPLKSNELRTSVFFEEWSRLLDRLAVLPENLVMGGDLNLHLDNMEDGDTKTFIVLWMCMDYLKMSADQHIFEGIQWMYLLREKVDSFCILHWL